VRIVHVANAYTPASGGIRTTVHALGHGYRAAGHEFVLVVPGPRAGDEDLPWGRRVTLAGPRRLRCNVAPTAIMGASS
jgi:alpha-1,6-mannosyltransferase